MKISFATTCSLLLLPALAKSVSAAVVDTKKIQRTDIIDRSKPQGPKKFFFGGFNGPVRFMWSGEFPGVRLKTDTYTVEVNTKGSGGGRTVYTETKTSNVAFESSGALGDNNSGLDYEVTFTCANAGAGANFCKGTFDFALVDCGCGPSEFLLTPCTFSAIGSSTPAVCTDVDPNPPDDPESLAIVNGRWINTGKSGPVISISATFGTSLTNGNSITQTRSESIGVAVSAGFSYDAPAPTGGIEGFASVTVDTEQSTTVAQQTSTSITASESTTTTVSCPPTSESSTGLWFIFQFQLSQEDDENGVGFLSLTDNFVCTESSNQLPICPLGFCGDDSCQTCLTPFEELEELASPSPN